MKTETMKVKYKVKQHLNFEDGEPVPVYNAYLAFRQWPFRTYLILLTNRHLPGRKRTIKRAEQDIKEHIIKEQFDKNGVLLHVEVTIDDKHPYEVIWLIRPGFSKQL